LKLPKGFVASGIRAGIRKKRPDLGLIGAEEVPSATDLLNQSVSSPLNHFSDYAVAW